MTVQLKPSKGTFTLLSPNATDATISSKTIMFVFQYNPEKLFHTFGQVAAPPTATNESAQPQGPPAEFFSLTFDLDSVEAELSAQNQDTAVLGLHPALAVLEMMMQPQTVSNRTSLPIVVFSWGAKRNVAVRFMSMSVEEKSFNTTLNPTRATVNITLKVLDSSETKNSQAARDLYVNHQNVRATLVDVYKVQSGQANLRVSSPNDR